ncbi:class IIb bacteriocin, lactobin A/cerein 7B family [Polaribacter sp. Hel1_33_78]|jgi:lactobin A/cerein 7B family class IIb bacteriocin|uniref:class IIb bacteriocin, lactobin A/cerein 7B family n=1 Tax=Polaribacter sp. Hel1_33_78 TaxID=1336804 RepID=UPI000879F927|nr:class IIb bacteriocin, lactobin A/cerein 7B family [Polaribacter sp. Hel1_33_78]MDA9254243.1 class IIb bacteriocin, lactobin A/cerein 7B family [Flavobacteriaceae bacterium]SDU11782.1 class IIb bacteriocin, lactobin A/cerein 7B family [Polaribacter sp. Hel1_33_78]
MKNLQNFGVKELKKEEIKRISGGWAWPAFVAGALLGGVIYDAAKWLICENNEAYGANMMASGSPGGHK